MWLVAFLFVLRMTPVLGAQPTPLARVAACAALGRETKKALSGLGLERASEVFHEGVPKLGDAGRCLGDPSGGGAWALVFERAKIARGDEGAGHVCARETLAFVADDGTVTRRLLEPTLFEDGPPIGPDDLPVCNDPMHGVGWELDRAYDWDHDGRNELALRWRWFSPDHDRTGIVRAAWVAGKDGAPPTIDIETFTAGRDAEGMFVTGLLDLDGDGAPDVAEDRALGWAGGMDGWAACFPQVWHALRDGRFAADDGAVRAYYRQRCGGKPVGLGDLRPPTLRSGAADDERSAAIDTLVDKAVCARLWGVPNKDVLAQLNAAAREILGASPGIPAEPLIDPGSELEVPVDLSQPDPR